MTAATVGDRKVIEDQPARSPLHTDARPVFFKQIRELLLDDGTIVFGCVHCEFAAATIGPVRPHLKVHTRPLASSRGPGRPRVDATEMSLADLLRRVKTLDQAEADRDTWRKRALEAERCLRTLRNALNGSAR
jgi:hypothetical protein